jgi:hypothetical protein
MGLLLSVLVVCVGVLEVLACVRHFQDGYLPLWTPHCAVTSGCTSSYERWRKKPSDSCEFRSFDEVCGEVNHAANQSSENCVESSPNIRNGFAGKQIEKTTENSCSADYYCQDSKNDVRTELPPSVDYHTEEIYDYRNISEISAPSLVSDEDERKVVNKSTTNAVPSQRIPDIPHGECDMTYQEEPIARFPSQSSSEKHAVSVGTQYDIVDSRVHNENAVPLSDSVLEESFVHDDGAGKRHISAKAIDVETDDDLCSSPGATVQRNSEDVYDDILDGKQLAQHDIFRREAEVEIESLCLYNEEVRDALRETSLSAIGKPNDQVPVLKNVQSVPVPDCFAATFSRTIQDFDQTPNTETKSQIQSPGFTLNEPFSTGLQFKSQILPPAHEISAPSSVLPTQEDKPTLEVVAREPSDATGEITDTHLDGNSLCRENESAVPATPSCEHRFQDLRTPSSVSEDTSGTHVETSAQHNVPVSEDGIEPEPVGTVCNTPVCSLEEANARNISGLNIGSESQTPLNVESVGENLETDIRKRIGAHNGHVGRSATACDTASTIVVLQGSEILQQNNLENASEAHSLKDGNQGLQEDGTETQHEFIGPGPSSDFENEREISSKREVSENRLDSQTILTDPVILLDEGTLHDSGFSGSNEMQPSVCERSSDALTSSLTSVTPLTVDTSVQFSVSSPLTVDTSAETSASVTPLPADHQPSLSPPRVPSTPKKSKADISWPTFFPGTPVIKRPSVSFATPEAVFTSEDQDVLRQYVEEVAPGVSCLKIRDDDSTATESDTICTGANNEKQSQSPGTPERSDSFEEEPGPVIYRERSPSTIAAGNDFSRKELKLQRRRSYKQKRYSSATEIRTGDEEAEDRSFSENNPGIIRATSVVEPRKRYKKPAKSSSFEDALLCDIEVEEKGETFLTTTTQESSGVADPEGMETENQEVEDTQQQEHKNFEEVVGEAKEKSDISDCPRVPTERNEPKYDKTKLQVKEGVLERKEAAEGQKEELEGDNEEECSASEEQSSSQQKSPPKEAFWVSSEDGIQ